MALPLSVAIVCKNNEGTIGRTLDSVAYLASEIVAVDSGSTDGTIGLLEAARARVIRSPWLGHVKTKQKALEACGEPWVLCLDSDESLEKDLAAAVERAVSADEAGVAGYRVNRKVWYAGRFLEHAWQPEFRLRLVRRGRARWTGIDPHDALEVVGDEDGKRDGPKAVRDLPGTLRHDSISTFGEFYAKQVAYGRLMAEGLHARGKRGEAWRVLASPMGAFAKQMLLKRAFLDGWRGWLAAGGTATAAMAKHAALVDLGKAQMGKAQSSNEEKRR